MSPVCGIFFYFFVNIMPVLFSVGQVQWGCHSLKHKVKNREAFKKKKKLSSKISWKKLRLNNIHWQKRLTWLNALACSHLFSCMKLSKNIIFPKGKKGTYIQFLLTWPLGRVSHRVAMSVDVYVPFPLIVTPKRLEF